MSVSGYTTKEKTANRLEDESAVCILFEELKPYAGTLSAESQLSPRNNCLPLLQYTLTDPRLSVLNSQ